MKTLIHILRTKRTGQERKKKKEREKNKDKK